MQVMTEEKFQKLLKKYISMANALRKAGKPVIIFYDIETALLKAWLFRLGKQVINHKQLDRKYSRHAVITVQFCLNNDKKADVLHWGFQEQDRSIVVDRFDQIIRAISPDIIIGKNNRRFDDPNINSVRMWQELDPMHEWLRNSDDLESQFRSFFYLASYSLDYMSKEFGLGGKIKMEFEDWINIMERNEDGLESFKKIIKYGGKDAQDTRWLWNRCFKYFRPKANLARILNKHCCVKCGSTSIIKRGFGYRGKTKYQRYFCHDCRAYTSEAPISSIRGKEGQLGPG